MRALVAVALFLVPMFAHAQEYEQVLVPLVFHGKGANGADWRTSAVIRNDSDQAVKILNFRTLDAKSRGAFITEHPKGLLLYVPREQADQVHFLLRVFDATRKADRFGVEIPVVREGEIRDSRAVLQEVPLLTTYRRTLRIYGLDPGGSLDFRVKASIDTDVVGETIDFATTVTLQPGGGAAFAAQPAYYEADITALFPNIPQFDPDHPPGFVSTAATVEVEPVVPGTRFWAFVTITNNATSEVLLATSQ